MKLTNNQKIGYAHEGLAAYQNSMVQVFGGDYKLSFEALENMMGARPNFIMELGDAIGTADIGQRRLQEAMERVALKSSPDEIPKAFTFIQGIVDELSDFDFSVFGDAAIQIAKEANEKTQKIIKDVGEGVSGISGSIGFLGRNLNMIIVAGLALGATLLIIVAKKQ